MGYEATCTARLGRKTSAGKALLETEVLSFRGDFRVDVRLDEIAELKVEGGALLVRTAAQELRLDLGPSVAQHWARLVKEPKGLFEKLEITSDARVAVAHVADGVFLAALRERAAAVDEERVPEGAHTIFFGVDGRDALHKVAILRARMSDDGTLWIVRPKGSKAVSEGDVLAAVRAAGLVDTKVVAFSRTHTAHKCVVPVEQRGQARQRPAFVSIPPPPPGTVPADGSAPRLSKASARAGAGGIKPARKSAPRAVKGASTSKARTTR